MVREILCAVGVLATFSSAAAGTTSREVAQLLDAVSASVPELLWMERLSLSGEQIQIHGKAFNTNAIATFIENLDRKPAFSEPTLRNATQETGSLYSFDLSFEHEVPWAEPIPLTLALGELPKVLDRLRGLIGSKGIAVRTWTPGSLPDQSGPPVEVDLSVEAKSYNDLVLLFDRLHRFPQLIAVRTMDIVKKGPVTEGGLSVDLHLEVQGKSASAGRSG